MKGDARARRSGAFLLALTLSAPVLAATQPEKPTSVVLDATSCPSVAEPELLRIAGIELGALLVPLAGAEAQVVTITCNDERAIVRVHVRGARGSQDPERQLLLRAFPGDAAPRVLALAAIELLATVDVRVRETLEGARANPRAATVAPPNGNALSDGPTTVVGVAALRRVFVRTAGLDAWGGRLEGVHDRPSRLRLAGDLEAAFGSTMSALGKAEAVLMSTGWFGGLRASPTAGVTVSLVAGARGGLARFQGTPSQGSGASASAVWRPWWGPALAVRAAVGGRRFAAIASVEAGVTARGAEALAATTTVLAVQGGWVTGAVGIQF